MASTSVRAPLLTLKIHARTLRAITRGVPAIMELLQHHQAAASFYFALGPDRTGRDFSRLFRQGSGQRFGFSSQFYGTLLPAPVLSKQPQAVAVMRAVQETGFHCAPLGWDVVSWEKQSSTATASWTREQMERARSAYRAIFEHEPDTLAASGWQTNPHYLRLQKKLGYRYSSDCQAGSNPAISPVPQQAFWPLLRGEALPIIQIPDTLPSLEQLYRQSPRITLDEMHLHQLALTAPEQPSKNHVMTLNAELDGQAWLTVVARLLAGWQEQGYTFSDMPTLVDQLSFDSLPYCELHLPNSSMQPTIQGNTYLGRLQQSLRR